MSKTRMLIDYTPGEECRIAVVEDDRLEEHHAERFDAVSRVGNIYLGRIANIEPAIQAAFIDFGVGAHGFLHVTDLHPRFFPDSKAEATERVGKKTPRRERPPIQACLKRGQEIMVQVIKEGVGTKGPTLTSYISIPGRFLVMMPQMDRVGVSRKVEDDDRRKQMREILDALDLPDGFGFILRTAGFDRNKTELKRDLAYLQRLWKDMERRRERDKAPCPLYSESDLLVRTLRDALTSDIKEIIVDDEQALERAGNFLRILTPRARPKLLHYAERTPLFQAYGVEQQITNINAREVPLPAGGALVFDETEAVVAIDVNSGKSRKARDSETNAYQTNLEATDEICRQLRLRDLGGVVICDLIDMREAKHRRSIEQRFRERLRRDRAKSTILAISNFGILEMTRQRMRGSHETVHFAPCPTCHGRGVLQRPASVADDSLRTLEAVLAPDRVAKVEMVVSPRVASELLSSRRKSLGRLERVSGKHVDVRVSETMPVDRVVFYAYDDLGADVDIAKLPAPTPPKKLKEWEVGDAPANWAVDLKQQVEEESHAPEEPGVAMELHPIELSESDMAAASEAEEAEGGGGGGKKKRRRRRRRKKKGAGAAQADSQGEAAEASAETGDGTGSQQREQAASSDGQASEAGPGGDPGASDGSEEKPKPKRRRRRRRSKKQPQETDADQSQGAEQPVEQQAAQGDVPQGSAGSDQADAGEQAGAADEIETAPARKKKRRRVPSKAEQEASSEGVDSGATDVSADDGGADSGNDEGDRKTSRKRSRSTRRKKAGGSTAAESSPADQGARAPATKEVASDNGEKPKPKRRSLYGAARRKLTPSERPAADRE